MGGGRYEIYVQVSLPSPLHPGIVGSLPLPSYPSMTMHAHHYQSRVFVGPPEFQQSYLRFTCMVFVVGLAGLDMPPGPSQRGLAARSAATHHGMN